MTRPTDPAFGGNALLPDSRKRSPGGEVRDPRRCDQAAPASEDRDGPRVWEWAAGGHDPFQDYKKVLV